MSPEQAQQALDDLLACRDKGHAQAAGWVGDAIYGVNDGLGSIFGIVSGVSGATLGNSHFVLIAGLAGMVASALSMGSGAYLAAKSEREIFEAEFAREWEAVEDNCHAALKSRNSGLVCTQIADRVDGSGRRIERVSPRGARLHCFRPPSYGAIVRDC
jgi:hypothetical protein